MIFIITSMIKKHIHQKNNLKKKKLIYILILNIILFSPLIHSSLAQRSVGIGVKEGEKYEWTLKLNISNYIELLRNTGGTVSTELMTLNLQGNSDGLIQLIVNFEILDIPDEFFVDSFFDITFTIVEAEFALVPDYNISQIPIFFPLNFSIKPSLNFSILKGDTPNYFTAPIGFFLIVPTDLDWTVAAAQLKTEILSPFRRNYGITDMSVLPQSNGLRVTSPADTTLLATELNLNYNTKGVLETASGKYGGATLFSLELETEGTIAFELPFFLSVFAIAIVVLILRNRKKLH